MISKQIEDIDEYNETSMLVRQRSKSPSGGAGYQRVSTEDELDNIPTLDYKLQVKAIPTKKSATCKFCYILVTRNFNIEKSN